MNTISKIHASNLKPVSVFSKKVIQGQNTQNYNQAQISKLYSNAISNYNQVPVISFSSRKRAIELENDLSEIVNDNKNLFLSVKPNVIKNISKKIVEEPNKPILVSVTGESASGKSTFCKLVNTLKAKSNLPISFVSTDNYFKDISALIEIYGSVPGVIASGYELDGPNNFQLEQLRSDITALSNGEDVRIPKYYMDETGKSIPNAVPVSANRIIFVEGVATHFDNLDELFDLNVYIDSSDEVRKTRLLKRAPERGQNPEQALAQWEYVKDAGKRFVAPAKSHCDVVLNGEETISAIDNLLHKIVSTLKK